eukprot:gnl/TRDRNA2_/TRDRNA2_154654_c0_seq1.p1 gnl/TRDRNA2_/TRDRNA2_154654_c0~~gnl/TRDRNA2_/TRDRNA2_154654_c0_seq1.p1  ORF type:complete len:185 (-),score=34.56 gnl/TRDRNA2_/TRDRNA2_154654_c0_seq1:9-563(-)
MHLADPLLFAALARTADCFVGEFQAQGLANMVWAFSIAGRSDTPTFAALAAAVGRVVGEFNIQELAVTTWALATMLQPVSALPDLLSALSAVAGSEPQPTYYRMSMQAMVATGQIVAGFMLLARLEARGLLSISVDDRYSLLRMLLEACGTAGDFAGASVLRAAVARQSLSALKPVAAVEGWTQ